MTRWNTEKQFASFLELYQNNAVSGGRVLHHSTHKVYNPAPMRYSFARRVLTHSQTALGGVRRLKGDSTPKEPVCCHDHHLARLVSGCLRYSGCVEKDVAGVEESFRLQRLR